jgi:hypothetical protein
MVHESNRNLRLDRRLMRRRGWLSPEELEKELAALPDATDKAEWSEPESPRGAGAPERDDDAGSEA